MTERLNVFEIARNVAAVVGMRDIDSLVGNPEPHARAMVVLLNRGCKNMAQMRGTSNQGWIVLTREFAFQTVPGQASYAFPDDYQELVDGTVWNRDTYREARGPLSPTEWQRIKSGLVETTSIAPNFRIRRNVAGTGKAFWVDPVPSQAQDLVIEYVSNQWLTDASQTVFRGRVAADTDLTLFDDDLVEQDLTWRFKQSRGLSFAPELAEFELERDKRFAKDGGLRTIRIGRTPAAGLQGQVPDSGFGGVSV
ncbi:MAG: hypothetical protein F4213_09660 [Boseongicola sp. SB0677_bin_26]|nr:hypothetical protein [Boseongicola sp. SB0677_bin_26]